jgi:pimeloyl-ACP methyl ester carboxylesterase
MTQPAPTSLPAFKSEEGRTRYLAAYDAVLRDWPVPYEEFDIATCLGPTHVIASGASDAPALVLLPSFAGTATAWRLNAEELSRHFRTYAVDVIGQPGKSVTTMSAIDRHQFATWFTDMLDGLKVPRASIAGCSFGGFLALNQASVTPGRVARVVLISPVGLFGSQFWKLFYAMRIKGPIRKLMRRLKKDKRAPTMADLGMMPKDLKWAALMGVTMAEAPQLSTIQPTKFPTAQIRAIRTPTLLLIGDRERLYDPRETLELAKKRMPHLQGAIVKDADHIAAMAQPADVNERIVRFLTAETGR